MLKELKKNPLTITRYINYFLKSSILKNNIVKEINGVKYGFDDKKVLEEMFELMGK